MDPVARIAEDEFGNFREFFDDEELARRTVESDARTAAALLIRSGHLIIAIVLWRQRTGSDLRTAMTAVDAISDAIKRGEEITPNQN